MVGVAWDVRVFEPGDAAVLTALLHDAYAELGAMGLNYTAVDQVESVTLERASRGRTWLAEDRGRLVGSLTMSLPPSAELAALTAAAAEPRRAWLNQVAVAPAERGRGIAADLWRRGRDWAAASGAASIGVDTAVPAAHLVDLYTAWGFRRIETIHWPGKTYDSAVMLLGEP